MGKGLPSSLKELLADPRVGAGIEAPVEAGRLWAAWSDLVGPEIAGHAEPTSLRRGVLRIRVDSPGWATEISYLGAEIARRANGLAGRALVTEVRVWVGSGPFAGAGSATARGGKKASLSAARGAVAPPPSEDPQEAVARARAAWAKGLEKGSRRTR